jgi:hypothetical protein
MRIRAPGARVIFLAVPVAVLLAVGTLLLASPHAGHRGGGDRAPLPPGYGPQSQPPVAVTGVAGIRGLHVRGNQIVDASEKPVRLTGFNNSGAEYACQEGWGIFDTPNGNIPSAVVAAMATWAGANAVRVPVNEQCWLGLPGVKAAYAGPAYRGAIERYVSLLTSRGFAVILDLAGTAPDSETSANQEEMPDQHSVAFWRSAAGIFRNDTSVIFDLFNEPWPDNGADTAATWSCWRNGGCAESSANGGARYRAVGLQKLVNAVRSNGARNIVVAEGIQYAETVDQWLQYRPSDPAGNLIASVHVYSFNACSHVRCYNGAMRRVATRAPLLIGEFGPDLTVAYSAALDQSCPSRDIGRTSFDSTLLTWAFQHGVSWTAWSWNPWGDCWSLVRNFRGTPTSPYGTIIKSALAGQLSQSGS